jgi:hypothetical protein
MNYFCSDELGARLKAEKLDGWEIQQRCILEKSLFVKLSG